MTAALQSLTCQALGYFGQGDFHTLRRIIDLLAPQAAADIYYRSNLAAALSIAGAIDVRESDEKREWWTSFEGDIRIEGARSKLIPTSEAGLKSVLHELRPVARDAHDNALILGTDLEESNAAFFGSSFQARLPTFAEIESQVCKQVTWDPDTLDQVEVYFFTDGVWRSAKLPSEGSALVRVRHRLGGMRHYVVYPRVRLCFQLIRSEWMFFTAINLMGYKDRLPINISSSVLAVERSFRLPLVLQRYLFASSDSVRIGPRLEFFRPTSAACDTLFRYFHPGFCHES